MTKKYSKPISLYPLSTNNALRAALQTPPEKKRVVRAMLETPKDKIEIFKEQAEDKAKPKSKGWRGRKKGRGGSSLQ
jgi:hypothetical protein